MRKYSSRVDYEWWRVFKSLLTWQTSIKQQTHLCCPLWRVMELRRGRRYWKDDLQDTYYNTVHAEFGVKREEDRVLKGTTWKFLIHNYPWCTRNKERWMMFWRNDCLKYQFSNTILSIFKGVCNSIDTTDHYRPTLEQKPFPASILHLSLFVFSSLPRQMLQFHITVWLSLTPLTSLTISLSPSCHSFLPVCQFFIWFFAFI